MKLWLLVLLMIISLCMNIGDSYLDLYIESPGLEHIFIRPGPTSPMSLSLPWFSYLH